MRTKTGKLRYNIGSGKKPMPGYVNVDLYEDDADEHWNASAFPWPIESGTVDDLQMHHVLEHLPDLHGTIAEAWRVLRVGGTWTVTVPHCRGPNARCVNHCRMFSVHTMPRRGPLVTESHFLRVPFDRVCLRFRARQGKHTPFFDRIMSGYVDWWEVYGWPPPQEIVWTGRKSELTAEELQ